MKTGKQLSWDNPLITKIFKTASANSTSTCVFRPVPDEASEAIQELLAVEADEIAQREEAARERAFADYPYSQSQYERWELWDEMGDSCWGDNL
jgi:hypothetical protein